MGERLVRVESFDELRTGMRVVVRPCDWCGSDDVGVVGGFDPEVTGQLASGATTVLPAFLVIGGCKPRHWITRSAVRAGIVFRFAEDIDSDAELAAEANPYLERSTVGTGGRDEVRIAAKDRAR